MDLAAQLPILPAGLNEEQKNFAAAVHRSVVPDDSYYDCIPRRHDELNRSLQVFAHTYEEVPVNDLGLLQCLPMEIFTEIVLELDLTSIVRMRQVNRNARQIVSSISQYRFVIQHGVDFLGFVVRSGLGLWYNLDDVVCLLRQETCFTCDQFATYVSLPTWKKACGTCFYSQDAYDVLSKHRAAKLLKIGTIRLQRLVPVMRTGPSRTPVAYVSKFALRNLCTNNNIHIKLRSFHSSEAIQRLLTDASPSCHPAYKPLPFVNSQTGPTFGSQCRGCGDILSPRAFYDHISTCSRAQSMGRARGWSVVVTEEEDEWVLVKVFRWR